MKANRIDKVLSFTWARYLLVGMGAVMIDISGYFLLIICTSLSTSSAKKISFIAGAGLSYFSNKKFTFRINKIHWFAPALFAAVYLFGLFLNSVIHDFMYSSTSNKFLSVGVATFVSVAWNYIGQKFVVFSNKLTRND